MSVNPCLNARWPLHSPPSSHLRCMSTVSNCVARKPVQKGFVCYGCLFQYNLVLICFSSSYQPTFLGSATSVKDDVRYGFRCTSLDFVNKTQNVKSTRIKMHFAEPICVLYLHEFELGVGNSKIGNGYSITGKAELLFLTSTPNSSSSTQQ